MKVPHEKGKNIMTKGIMHKDITLLNLRAVGEDITKHGYRDSDGYKQLQKAIWPSVMLLFFDPVIFHF